MSLLLAIESTSGLYSVAAGAGDEVGSRRASRRDDPGFAGLGELVSAALAELGATAADVDRLAVDVGPGNLSSVRAAVAYVNGLAFSLDRKIFCANSLELMATAPEAIAVASELTAVGSAGGTVPMLCLRKASGGNAYLGLYEEGRPPVMHFGKLEQVVAERCGLYAALTVAGAFRDQVSKLLPDCHVLDTGVDHPSVDLLYRIARTADSDAVRVADLAQPLNEGSRVFHEQALPDDP